MPAPSNLLEIWANPPNIFSGAPMQAFMAQMNAAQNWTPQREQTQAQTQPQQPEGAPRSLLASYTAPTLPSTPRPMAAPGNPQQPRSVRTNNPGAMNYGPFAQRAGAIGSDGRLAIFPDIATGYGAMDRLLGSYGQQGRNTVASIIERWAPRNVDNNSTDAYIATVSRQLGIDPNAPIPSHLMPRVAEAMAAYEAGMPIPRY